MLRKKQLPTKSTVRVTVTLKKDNFNIQNNVKIKITVFLVCAKWSMHKSFYYVKVSFV